MKKLIAMLLAMIMVVSMAACGAKKEEPPTEEPEIVEPAPETEEPTEEPEVVEPETEEPAPETEEPTEEPEMELPEAATNASSEILNAIWNATPDEEKFPAAGGDALNMSMDAPGVVDLTSTDYITNILLVPTEQQANITEIGNLMHMMNSNTFTSGVYALTDASLAADFAAAMQERIQNNQWMCGFPEQLLIVDLNGSVLVAFGLGDIISSFAAHTAEVFADSTVLYNEAIGG